MRLNTIKLTIVFALMFCTNTILYGQLSKVHYIPPIGSGAEVGDHYLYVSTPNTGYINVTIKPISGTRADWKTFAIKNDEPLEFPITNVNSGVFDSPVVKDLNVYSTLKVKDGYIVESSDVTYVSFRMNSDLQANRFGDLEQYHSGAYVSKGEAALGTRFRPGNFVGASSNNTNNFISILATEDNTRVQLSEIPSGLIVMGHSGTFPIENNLDEGETWILGVTSDSNDLNPINEDQLSGFTGTLITSSDSSGVGDEKPVVVVSGSIEGTVLRDRSLPNRDYGFDQIVESDKIGHEYIVVKGLGDNATENIYIIADSDNTNIYLSGQTIPFASLNKGSYAVLDYTDYDSSNNNVYITTKDPTKKLFVYQTTGYSRIANQALVFVPPLSCSSLGNIDNIPLIDKIGSKVFTGGSLSIVTKNTANLEIFKDGLLFADKSGTAPVNLNDFSKSVVGKPEYSTYLLDSNPSDPLTSLSGRISIFSDEELYVASTTYGDAASSGSYYSGFVSNPPLQNNLTVSTLGSCVLPDGSSNTELTTSSTYDSYEWQKYNTTTDVFEAVANTKMFKPSSPGKYRLLAKLDCFAGKEYISDEIVVSLCPSDFDNDGIPDTIDLDRDNDGILNAFESLGKGSIDFSSPTAPKIILPDNPTNNITSTGIITPTGAAVSGNAAGELSSLIAVSGINQENKYALNPILPSGQPLNIRINESPTSTATEFEIIKIVVYPATENITLLDPGEKLLVDNGTGFKRIPKEGISGNEIKFKYNPNPLDSTLPFEILGVNIIGIDLIHERSASANTFAMFNAEVEIIDYERDTDSNMTINSLDADSDGDVCSDVIEAGYEDPDNDGFAGISPIFYDPNNPNATADARGRVVFPGYDYDQLPQDGDNNSIYDFLEIGTAATLTKNFASANGILCEGESLSLSLETPDSDTVEWEVDSDQDGIFEDASTLGTITQDADDEYTFKINSVSASLNKAIFRARLSKKAYSCTTDTQTFTLTVNTNTNKPTLEPLMVVCKGGTVADLDVPNVVWFEAATGGTALPNSFVLTHNSPYFAASEVNGCVGDLRSETKVVVNEPVISTASGETTFCASEEITLMLDADKILPSPDDFARMNNLIYIEDAAGPIKYDNGFYYTQEVLKPGVQPIKWVEAKALGESIVGATMYVINSDTEEEAVYKALQNMGLTGDDKIAFWLGLSQDENAADYSEPDGGWYWVDGTPLTYKNWWDNEPNDYPSDAIDGEENYGQFEFGNNGRKWNDMNPITPEGQSYPLFEYKAQTEIKWFTESGSVLTPIPGSTNSSEIKLSPTVTTSYVARVSTNGVVCESVPFTITINPLPIANAVPDEIEICVEDNNGAIAANDLRGVFDLTSANATILGTSQSESDYSVTFYTSKSGAEAETAAAKIDTPDTYTNTSNTQTVYYNVTNNTTGCVSTVSELTLLAQPLPPTITIPNVVVCDNLVSGSDEDGILKFDLDAETAKIQTLLGSATKYSISYHENLADAEANASAISEYTTTTSDNRTKTIVVRLEDNTTGCYRTDNSLNLVVAELPIISASNFLREQCDTDTDGFVQDNLTLYNDVFSSNYLNETFTFYTDSSHNNQIPDPTKFVNTSMNQMVYIKITNANGCERTYDPATNNKLTIEIRIRASTIKTSFLETYYACLEQTNTSNNGITTFEKNVFADLEAKLIAEHPAFANSKVSIQFFESESDAASKIDPIDTTQDYVNTTPNTQAIWAAVDANGLTDTTCLGLKQVANLIVEPLAILHPVTISRQCDGDSPLDLDNQDGIFPFNTSTVMDQLLLMQDPANYDIDFYDENYVRISKNSFPAVYNSPSQIIRVTVANKPSKVSPPCYQEATIEFTVDDSPEVGTHTIPELCDNDDGVLDAMAKFDTSNLNAELLDGQTNMKIRYLQRDSAGNETDLGTSLPNPFTTATTKVIAQIYNPANMTCVLEESITFQVNENPVFDLDKEKVFCQNDITDTIGVTNPSATYTYSWTINGVDLMQNTQNVTISEGGTYSVTATNTLTGCSTAKTIIVKPSEIAMFTPEDVSIFDLTGNGSNRIEIQTGTLGIGDYEFALYGPPYLYQDSPLFEGVPPGIHTVSVRDKNGCGIVRHEVSVIGYSLYFTPNGDNKNDRWQILGLSDVFQAESLIYIFDRHGRLMAEIAADGPGWDGTYNGTLMPADDYWFNVKLEDGRSFTGHFSLIK